MAQQVISAEKMGPTPGSRSVGLTSPVVAPTPIACLVVLCLNPSPACPTEPLPLGWGQLVTECSLWARDCPPDRIRHLISLILQTRRLRHTQSHSAGRKQSQESNPSLWDLGMQSGLLFQKLPLVPGQNRSRKPTERPGV